MVVSALAGGMGSAWGVRAALLSWLCFFLVCVMMVSARMGSSARAGRAGVGAWCGLGVYCCGPGTSARAPGGFQSAASVLGLGASKSVCTIFKSRVSAPYNSLASPTGFQTSQEGSSSQCQIPGLGCLIWGSSPSVLKEDPRASDISLLFWVTH